MSQDSPSPPPQNAPERKMRELLLDDAVDMLKPLIRLWISQGIGFPEISRALRGGFIEAAESELTQAGAKVTDASLSLLSGVHRKEVKAFREALEAQQSGAPSHEQVSLSFAEQVFTRWTTDAAYRDAQGKPAVLPTSGPAPSFESLVASITKDFSRRTVLDELVRLGLVLEQGAQVIPQAEAMVPKGNAVDLAKYFHEQLHDHFAAGVKNIREVHKGHKAPFLEHSMYVNGISDASIEQLSQLAIHQWKSVFDTAVNAAQQRYSIDQQSQHTGRLRFGVYVYSEQDKPQS